MKNTHTCKALAITCIDFRFVTMIREYLTKKDLINDYDLITTPGSSLTIEKIADTILASKNLHNPKEIYIFDHEDCGAYGDDNSIERHKENLSNAKETVLKKYPDLKVRTFVAGFDQIKEIN